MGAISCSKLWYRGKCLDNATTHVCLYVNFIYYEHFHRDLLLKVLQTSDDIFRTQLWDTKRHEAFFILIFLFWDLPCLMSFCSGQIVSISNLVLRPTALFKRVQVAGSQRTWVVCAHIFQQAVILFFIPKKMLLWYLKLNKDRFFRILINSLCLHLTCSI
jgi:hypothetical protein